MAWLHFVSVAPSDKALACSTKNPMMRHKYAPLRNALLDRGHSCATCSSNLFRKCLNSSLFVLTKLEAQLQNTMSLNYKRVTNCSSAFCDYPGPEIGCFHWTKRWPLGSPGSGGITRCFFHCGPSLCLFSSTLIDT